MGAIVSFNRDTSKDIVGNSQTVYTTSASLSTGMTLYSETGANTGKAVGTINQDGTFDVVNTTTISFSDSNDPLLLSYTIDGTTYTGDNNISVTNNETHTFSGLCNGDYLLVNESNISYYFGGGWPKTLDGTFVTDGSTIIFTGSETLTFSVSDVMAFSVYGCCIPYYTEVNYFDGTVKAAEDVKVGDKLLGYNELTKQFEEVEVLNIICKRRNKLIDIKTENHEIEITPDHPILTDKGWAVYNTNVGNYSSIEKIPLTTDLKVLTMSGKYEDIISIEVKELKEAIDTYTYDVTDNIDTYVAAGIISHNEKC